MQSPRKGELTPGAGVTFCGRMRKVHLFPKGQAVGFTDPEVFKFTLPAASHQPTLTRRSWGREGYASLPRVPTSSGLARESTPVLSLPLPGSPPPTTWHGTVDLGDTHLAPAAARDSQMDLLSSVATPNSNLSPHSSQQNKVAEPLGPRWAGALFWLGGERRSGAPPRPKPKVTRRCPGLSANPTATHPRTPGWTPQTPPGLARGLHALPPARVLSHLLM